MAVADNEARILDSLRQIFPQLNDGVLSHSIRNVRETVGSDPGTIISGCIDMLLAQQTACEMPAPPNRRPISPISLDHDENRSDPRTGIKDNEIIFVGSSSRGAPNHMHKGRQPNNAGHCVINLIDEFEISVSERSSAPVNSVTDPPCSKQSVRRSPKAETRRNSGSGILSKDPSATPTATISTAVTSAQKEAHEIQAVHVESNVDPMKDALKNLHSLFPDVEDSYLQSLVDKWSHLIPEEAVNNACNELLETKDYPRKPVLSSPPTRVSSLSENQNVTDYFKDFSTQVSNKYRHQCFQILQNEFTTISVKYIRLAMAKFKGHYAPSKRYLQEQLRVSSRSATSTSTGAPYGTQSVQLSSPQTQDYHHKSNDFFIPPKIELLRYGRPLVSVCPQSEVVKELQMEREFMNKYELSKSEEIDRMLAVSLNEEQYEEEGQKIECGCCYGDAAFEDMVQCIDGHLFCASCLMNYAKEAAFGQGKADLTCMSDGCDSTFPMSQLKKALPTNVLEKYEDRVQEESLLLAQMDDFVRCPSCDFAAILPGEEKVFKCQNPSCAKETCRYCKEEWSEHFGLKCNEVEKSAQKDVRLSYEEKMTMAKIRKCPKCGCEFTKSDGCNKMTCRCGTTMCYICRKPSINYSHFCQHPRDPGKACTKCTSCSLWSDPSEDDNRAVKELEKEALEAKRKFEEESVQLEANPAKKVKTN